MILKIKHFRNVKIIKKEVNGINNLKNERTAQSMFVAYVKIAPRNSQDWMKKEVYI